MYFYGDTWHASAQAESAVIYVGSEHVRPVVCSKAGLACCASRQKQVVCSTAGLTGPGSVAGLIQEERGTELMQQKWQCPCQLPHGHNAYASVHIQFDDP